MSGQQQEKTRERTPANLGIKFNPALGAANLKRFYATVRALLKSNQESGELALAVLEGRANSSKESLVQDFVDNGEIDVVWCPGDDCIADVWLNVSLACSKTPFLDIFLE